MQRSIKGGPLKIAMLASFLSENDARIGKQRNALVERGHDVRLLSWVHENGPYPTLTGASLLDWRPGATKRAMLAKAYALLRGNSAGAANMARAAAQRAIMESALKQGRFDVVIVSDPETLIPAARAKTSSRYKLLYDAHEYYPNEVANQPERDTWVARTHSRYGGRLDAFITVNREIADLYGQISPNFPPAIVVHNASPLRGSVIDDGRLMAAAGLTASTRILLFQGGLAKDRGLATLVRAAAFFEAPWHLVIMGSGPLEADLRALAGPTVTFLPPAPWQELHLWTAGASLGAVLYEPTCMNQKLCSPNKLWELPAAGVPILATDLPFLGGMVTANKIGVTVPADAGASQIAQAIMSFTVQRQAQARESCQTFSRAHHWGLEAATFIDCVETT